MQILTYSKGLYSSWLFHKPERTLFDCGEGCALTLGPEVFAIERICIGHGHMDHIGGLLPLINIRNSTKGATDKPLEIYYPKGDMFIERLFPYLEATQNCLKYNLQFTPCDKDTIIPIDDKKSIRTFQTQHHKGLSLGYVMQEKRTMLNPKFSNLSQREISEGIINKTINKNELRKDFVQPVFAYALDAYKFNPKDVEGVEQIVMDSTFLDGSIRRNLGKSNEFGESKTDLFSHSTVEECIELAMQANVSKRVILAHFSPRYRKSEIESHVSKVIRKYNPPFQVIPISQFKPLEFESTIPNKDLKR